MNYCILLEDFEYRVNSTARREWAGTEVVLRKGTLFTIKDSDPRLTAGPDEVLVKPYNMSLGQVLALPKHLIVYLSSPIYSLMNNELIDVTSRRHRDDYIIRSRVLAGGDTVGDSIVACSLNTLDIILEDIKVKEEVYKIFKYKPIVNHGGWQGFIKDDLAITFRDVYDGTLKTKVDVVKIKDINQYRVSIDAILNRCKFKVIDYIASSKLFKFTIAKKELVGKIVKVESIELNVDVKASNDKQNTAYVITEDGRRLRFLLSDIEIIYPNLNGFKAPKDRTIKPGIVAKIKDNRRLGIPKNEQVKILNVKSVGNKKYAYIQHKNFKTYTPTNKLKVV